MTISLENEKIILNLQSIKGGILIQSHNIKLNFTNPNNNKQ